MEDYSILIYLLVLIVPLIATLNIKITYAKYKKVKHLNGKSGFEVAREILDRNGLNDIYIIETRGELSDCYDSSRKTVKLSKDIFHGTSIAAVSVAAHECGHAIQDKEGYFWIRLRSIIFPIISFGQKIAYVFLLVGIFLSIFNFIYAAIILTILSLVFQIVTLPVEFDASKRANKLLYEYGIIDSTEKKGVKKMLGSAAMTYVAAVLSSLLELFYLLNRLDKR